MLCSMQYDGIVCNDVAASSETVCSVGCSQIYANLVTDLTVTMAVMFS